ncbi:XdhC family protein [[Flexibacter] sp. ATCC 35208]|uniref:XdhC family protein n=1 Tax=[Flexibacter] sp. ATCC 35208 TaxID=1936242 RepID=UPI0009CE74A9|nr:XdhC/CoxI family protein [[Flexibacter] sp. ATCC 35208]OMP76545.1 xanthine dehydrogenase [[Flexibacter] sp. ATCC 35208]
MKKKLVIWELISESLRQHIPVMLLYVLQSDGSSPGRQGFFMAVNAVGNLVGSIGGGIMEHKFVEMAREQLMQGEEVAAVRRQVHDKSSPGDQSGMICSGEQTILLYRVTNKEAAVIQQIIHCLSQYKNGLLHLSPAGLQFREGPGSSEFMMHSPDNWVYTEQLGYRDHLYLVGGGHCSLAFSKIMFMLDFYIHVYDNRPGLNTFLQNECAHEKVIVEDYSQLKGMIPEGQHNYVVVMTMGYRSDDVVIRALLHKQFRYLGMLGSQAKITQLFEGYKAEGISSQVLQRIHAPVGMQIKSQTPEEIAVSIAAEIIRERNTPTPG